MPPVMPVMLFLARRANGSMTDMRNPRPTRHSLQQEQFRELISHIAGVTDGLANFPALFFLSTDGSFFALCGEKIV
jgi:hypothetical protein